MEKHVIKSKINLNEESPYSYTIRLKRVGYPETIPIIWKKISIGRSNCTYNLRSKKVSRNHCEIFIRDKKIYLSNSENAKLTVVNGRKINNYEECELIVNDLVGFGTWPYPHREYEKDEYVFKLERARQRIILNGDEISSIDLRENDEIQDCPIKLSLDQISKSSASPKILKKSFKNIKQKCTLNLNDGKSKARTKIIRKNSKAASNLKIDTKAKTNDKNSNEVSIASNLSSIIAESHKCLNETSKNTTNHATEEPTKENLKISLNDAFNGQIELCSTEITQKTDEIKLSENSINESDSAIQLTENLITSEINDKSEIYTNNKPGVIVENSNDDSNFSLKDLLEKPTKLTTNKQIMSNFLFKSIEEEKLNEKIIENNNLVDSNTYKNEYEKFLTIPKVPKTRNIYINPQNAESSNQNISNKIQILEIEDLTPKETRLASNQQNSQIVHQDSQEGKVSSLDQQIAIHPSNNVKVKANSVSVQSGLQLVTQNSQDENLENSTPVKTAQISNNFYQNVANFGTNSSNILLCPQNVKNITPVQLGTNLVQQTFPVINFNPNIQSSSVNLQNSLPIAQNSIPIAQSYIVTQEKLGSAQPINPNVQKILIISQMPSNDLENGQQSVSSQNIESSNPMLNPKIILPSMGTYLPNLTDSTVVQSPQFGNLPFLIQPAATVMPNMITTTSVTSSNQPNFFKPPICNMPSFSQGFETDSTKIVNFQTTNPIFSPNNMKPIYYNQNSATVKSLVNNKNQNIDVTQKVDYSINVISNVNIDEQQGQNQSDLVNLHTINVGNNKEKPTNNGLNRNLVQSSNGRLNLNQSAQSPQGNEMSAIQSNACIIIPSESQQNSNQKQKKISKICNNEKLDQNKNQSNIKLLETTIPNQLTIPGREIVLRPSSSNILQQVHSISSQSFHQTSLNSSQYIENLNDIDKNLLQNSTINSKKSLTSLVKEITKTQKLPSNAQKFNALIKGKDGSGHSIVKECIFVRKDPNNLDDCLVFIDHNFKESKNHGKEIVVIEDEISSNSKLTLNEEISNVPVQNSTNILRIKQNEQENTNNLQNQLRKLTKIPKTAVKSSSDQTISTKLQTHSDQKIKSKTNKNGEKSKSSLNEFGSSMLRTLLISETPTLKRSNSSNYLSSNKSSFESIDLTKTEDETKIQTSKNSSKSQILRRSKSESQLANSTAENSSQKSKNSYIFPSMTSEDIKNEFKCRNGKTSRKITQTQEEYLKLFKSSEKNEKSHEIVKERLKNLVFKRRNRNQETSIVDLTEEANDSNSNPKNIKEIEAINNATQEISLTTEQNILTDQTITGIDPNAFEEVFIEILHEGMSQDQVEISSEEFNNLIFLDEDFTQEILGLNNTQEGINGNSIQGSIENKIYNGSVNTAQEIIESQQNDAEINKIGTPSESIKNLESNSSNLKINNENLIDLESQKFESQKNINRETKKSSELEKNANLQIESLISKQNVIKEIISTEEHETCDKEIDLLTSMDNTDQKMKASMINQNSDDEKIQKVSLVNSGINNEDKEEQNSSIKKSMNIENQENFRIFESSNATIQSKTNEHENFQNSSNTKYSEDLNLNQIESSSSESETQLQNDQINNKPQQKNQNTTFKLKLLKPTSQKIQIIERKFYETRKLIKSNHMNEDIQNILATEENTDNKNLKNSSKILSFENLKKLQKELLMEVKISRKMRRKVYKKVFYVNMELNNELNEHKNSESSSSNIEESVKYKVREEEAQREIQDTKSNENHHKEIIDGKLAENANNKNQIVQNFKKTTRSEIKNYQEKFENESDSILKSSQNEIEIYDKNISITHQTSENNTNKKIESSSTAQNNSEIPIKRSRGRPRKTIALQICPPVRKRGRPPKKKRKVNLPKIISNDSKNEDKNHQEKVLNLNENSIKRSTRRRRLTSKMQELKTRLWRKNLNYNENLLDEETNVEEEIEKRLKSNEEISNRDEVLEETQIEIYQAENLKSDLCQDENIHENLENLRNVEENTEILTATENFVKETENSIVEKNFITETNKSTEANKTNEIDKSINSNIYANTSNNNANLTPEFDKLIAEENSKVESNKFVLEVNLNNEAERSNLAEENLNEIEPTKTILPKKPAQNHEIIETTQNLDKPGISKSNSIEIFSTDKGMTVMSSEEIIQLLMKKSQTESVSSVKLNDDISKESTQISNNNQKTAVFSSNASQNEETENSTVLNTDVIQTSNLTNARSSSFTNADLQITQNSSASIIQHLEINADFNKKSALESNNSKNEDKEFSSVDETQITSYKHESNLVIDTDRFEDRTMKTNIENGQISSKKSNESSSSVNNDNEISKNKANSPKTSIFYPVDDSSRNINSLISNPQNSQRLSENINDLHDKTPQEVSRCSTEENSQETTQIKNYKNLQEKIIKTSEITAQKCPQLICDIQPKKHKTEKHNKKVQRFSKNIFLVKVLKNDSTTHFKEKIKTSDAKVSQKTLEMKYEENSSKIIKRKRKNENIQDSAKKLRFSKRIIRESSKSLNEHMNNNTGLLENQTSPMTNINNHLHSENIEIINKSNRNIKKHKEVQEIVSNKIIAVKNKSIEFHNEENHDQQLQNISQNQEILQESIELFDNCETLDSSSVISEAVFNSGSNCQENKTSIEIENNKHTTMKPIQISKNQEQKLNKNSTETETVSNKTQMMESTKNSTSEEPKIIKKRGRKRKVIEESQNSSKKLKVEDQNLLAQKTSTQETEESLATVQENLPTLKILKSFFVKQQEGQRELIQNHDNLPNLILNSSSSNVSQKKLSFVNNSSNSFIKNQQKEGKDSKNKNLPEIGLKEPLTSEGIDNAAENRKDVKFTSKSLRSSKLNQNSREIASKLNFKPSSRKTRKQLENLKTNEKNLRSNKNLKSLEESGEISEKNQRSLNEIQKVVNENQKDFVENQKSFDGKRKNSEDFNMTENYFIENEELAQEFDESRKISIDSNKNLNISKESHSKIHQKSPKFNTEISPIKKYSKDNEIFPTSKKLNTTSDKNLNNSFESVESFQNKVTELLVDLNLETSPEKVKQLSSNELQIQSFREFSKNLSNIPIFSNGEQKLKIENNKQKLMKISTRIQQNSSNINKSYSKTHQSSINIKNYSECQQSFSECYQNIPKNSEIEKNSRESFKNPFDFHPNFSEIVHDSSRFNENIHENQQNSSEISRNLSKVFNNSAEIHQNFSKNTQVSQQNYQIPSLIPIPSTSEFDPQKSLQVYHHKKSEPLIIHSIEELPPLREIPNLNTIENHYNNEYDSDSDESYYVEEAKFSDEEEFVTEIFESKNTEEDENFENKTENYKVPFKKISGQNETNFDYENVEKSKSKNYRKIDLSLQIDQEIFHENNEQVSEIIDLTDDFDDKYENNEEFTQKIRIISRNISNLNKKSCLKSNSKKPQRNVHFNQKIYVKTFEKEDWE